MSKPLENGKYVLVNVGFGRTIGAPPSPAPMRPIIATDSGETVFTFERAGNDTSGRPLYRVKLGNASVILVGNSVIVDVNIPTALATLWMVESKGDNIYGLVQGNSQKYLEPLGWTLRDPSTPVSGEFVPQSMSLPPFFFFRDNQVYKLNRVG